MTIIFGLISLSILVLFHEAGHFALAKVCGVKVEAFSLGMGPVLLHKTLGETDYRLSLFPIGGYCGMKGEDDYETAIEQGAFIQASPDSFYGTKSIFRLLIAFAGPFSNFVLSILAMSIVAMIGSSYYSYSTKIKLPEDPNIVSNARLAGLQDGDRILQIDGKDMQSFSDIAMTVATNACSNICIKVLRGQDALDFIVPVMLDKSTGEGKIGIMAQEDTPIRIDIPKKILPQALLQGMKDTIDNTVLIIKGFAMLFKGIDLKNAVAGPVQITSLLGQSATRGIDTFLSVMALISLSLCIMNLLPVPVLDGGLILFAFIETVSRRRLPPKFLHWMQIAGIAVLVTLMFLAISTDIMHYLF